MVCSFPPYVCPGPVLLTQSHTHTHTNHFTGLSVEIQGPRFGVSILSALLCSSEFRVGHRNHRRQLKWKGVIEQDILFTNSLEDNSLEV